MAKGHHKFADSGVHPAVLPQQKGRGYRGFTARAKLAVKIAERRREESRVIGQDGYKGSEEFLISVGHD